jgi:hypothetical protein
MARHGQDKHIIISRHWRRHRRQGTVIVANYVIKVQHPPVSATALQTGTIWPAARHCQVLNVLFLAVTEPKATLWLIYAKHASHFSGTCLRLALVAG